MIQLKNKLLAAIGGIENAYYQAQSEYHNYEDWEKEQWDRIKDAIQHADLAALEAIEEAYAMGRSGCREHVDCTYDAAVFCNKCGWLGPREMLNGFKVKDPQ